MSRFLKDALLRGVIWALCFLALVARFWGEANFSWVLVVSFVVLGALLLGPLSRHRKSKVLDPRVADILLKHVRFYRVLDEVGQKRFCQRVQELLALYTFERGGQYEGAIELETRVLAVAGAAVLVHQIDGWRFSGQRSIVIYPSAYVIGDHRADGEVAGADFHASGSVHHGGPIVFSKEDLEDGWDNPMSGRNVSIHEWAHVLDLDDGFADGMPEFVADPERWSEVIEVALGEAKMGDGRALRRYAGTNRAETFAVASEVFFERPSHLKRHGQELYNLLASFYCELEEMSVESSKK